MKKNLTVELVLTIIIGLALFFAISFDLGKETQKKIDNQEIRSSKNKFNSLEDKSLNLLYLIYLQVPDNYWNYLKGSNEYKEFDKEINHNWGFPKNPKVPVKYQGLVYKLEMINDYGQN